MICEHVLHHVDAWIRGELDTATANEVAGHMASCTECAREADMARALLFGLQELRVEAPAHLVAKIISRRPTPARWFTPLRALAAGIVVTAVFLFNAKGREDLDTKMEMPMEAPAPIVAPPAPPAEEQPVRVEVEQPRPKPQPVQSQPEMAREEAAAPRPAPAPPPAAMRSRSTDHFIMESAEGGATGARGNVAADDGGAFNKAAPASSDDGGAFRHDTAALSDTKVQ